MMIVRFVFILMTMVIACSDSVAAAKPETVARLANALSTILTHSFESHEHIAREIGAPDLIVRVWKSAGQRDPGLPNWLWTQGHRHGLIWFRWFLPDVTPDRPTTRVVKIADL